MPKLRPTMALVRREFRPMRRNKGIYPSQQRGLALVLVVWILTLLILMAGSFAMSMRRESSVSYAITASAEALALAESGVTLAQFNLTQGDPEQRWLTDGSIYEIMGPDSRIRIRIFAESGKVDLNTSGEEELEAVLRAAVNDDWQRQALLNAILDWRDADDDTRTQGAEKRQYRLAGLAYEPSNAAFQSVEELQQVLGMNAAIFEVIQPFITVYSGGSAVDKRSASAALLQLLAGDLKGRNMHDAELEQRLQANGGSEGGLADGGQVFSNENQTYTIIVEALVRQEASAGVETVVSQRSNDYGLPFETLDWKQNLQPSSLFNPAMESQVVTIQDEFRYGD